MAATRWSIRNYNAVLREVKERFSVSHREAQTAYRNLRETVGRPVRGVDVKRDPARAEQAVRSALPPPPAPPAPPSGGGLRGIAPPGDRVIQDVSEWYDAYGMDLYDWDGDSYDEWESSADYPKE